MFARLASALRSERGYTLVEMLVAITMGIVVFGALTMIIVVSQHQETQITDRVQADQISRTALERIQDELHSSCIGGSEIPIQKPDSSLVGLEATNEHNLWFVSTYGLSNSAEAELKNGRLHDINWTATGTSNSKLPVGRLTDYWFPNEPGATHTPPANPWLFPATLSTATAGAGKQVLATNVVTPVEDPPGSGQKTPLFQYFKYDTISGDSTYGELVPLTSAELASMSESIRRSIAQVKIEFQQAPETHKTSQKADTRLGHTTIVSGSAVLRFTPSETTEEGTGVCT